ncbi:alpha/beta hydrolase [Marinomonas sp. 15G1-11]|uniref:Alpha/beta hydrolase n=1 Tax=Marinomonas phaeophyticola TaxID=3004091 RepID=A0ABT4JSR8_9GAMM|nr:alpha/beta hydrolase [Marinomonas sp. 15G1-11]MCZ2721435.1 alpha/beta hydrolase [Marinomonas sp. 15G1-11]
MKQLNVHSVMAFILWGGCALFLAGCSHQITSPSHIKFVNEQLSFVVEGNTAYVSGVLGHESKQELSRFIQKNPNISTLALVDIQGSLDQQATMETARLIRRLKLDTVIVRTGYVVSGGVDLFLGGVNRTIESGAGVGVHSWLDMYGVDPQELNMADPIHATYVNFYLEMGIPERFYWFSLDASPPERVYFLSPEEIYDFNLVTF